MKKIISKQNKGFTIIETMVSISLFLVVVMAGMTALLNANALHLKSQSMRSMMDNLTFIMDDISKNLRTGYNFHCINDNNLDLVALKIPKSCSYGEGIAFTTASGNTFVYFRSGAGGLYKATNPPFDQLSSYVQLNPLDTSNPSADSNLIIDPTSGFSVVGAEPPPGDTQQPFVVINLSGTMTSKKETIPFNIQTSVSQRLIDL